MENLFFKLLDMQACKRAIQETPDDEICILLPHYSINIKSKYSDVEQCDWDWNDFEEAMGQEMYVNDYDDLCVNPHGLEIY